MTTYPALPSPWGVHARSQVVDALKQVVYGPCEVAEAHLVINYRNLGECLELIGIPFPVLVSTPAEPGPWPTLVGLSFGPVWPIDESETWPLGRIAEAGWALAIVFVGDVEPDDAAVSSGCAVAKWAFGLQQIARTLSADLRFDTERMVAIGHSRLGKAALLAAALDSEFAGVVAIQSGCGGAAPSRTSVGETVAQITSSFPHWFSPAFAGYAADPSRLPLDQHWLLALCADRPLLLCNAADDTWANPLGQHEMLRLAADVYRETVPDLKIEATVGGRLAHFYRQGIHQVTSEDWDVILPWLQQTIKPRQ